MIGSLRGQVLEVGIQDCLLEVLGVGYRVVVPTGTASALRTDETTFLYIHEVIREDVHDLYGFLDLGTLRVFRKLLTVNGVGPKVAMTIMGIGDASVIQDAIMRGDVEALTSVPGVGKKTAQKIVLELKGQLVEVAEAPTEDREVVEALVALGYAAADAREAVKDLPETAKSTGDRVREALKRLSR